MLRKFLSFCIVLVLALAPASAKKKKAAAAQEEADTYSEANEADAAVTEEAEPDYSSLTVEKQKPVKNKDTKINWVTGLTSPFAHPLVIGSYNRFVLKSDWALVEWEDVNHYRKMKFDHDWYWTNFVLHPYQGNLAYMGARNANFNFIGALAMSTVSST
ncbi:MAG: DUF3943 domain-containing protein, partial [Treponema sp.]|nr:DUF3943 domain-containing protein [Treponema sp.]